MLMFKPVGIEDRDILSRYLYLPGIYDCENSFVNFFLWQEAYQTEYAFFRGALIIKQGKRGDDYFRVPLGLQQEDYSALAEELQNFSDGQVRFGGVCETQMGLVRDLFPGTEFVFDRDNSDYVYLQSELSTFSGRKFHGQKNHLNAFYRSHPDVVYEVIDKSNREECLDFALEWCDERSARDTTIDDEKLALKKAFQCYDKLGLRGGALRFDGRIQAMSVGEKFLTDAADLHFEKARMGVRGLYVAMCQAFARNAWDDVKYLNREEDMGLPGLRSAKEMLQPTSIWKKYIGKVP